MWNPLRVDANARVRALVAQVCSSDTGWSAPVNATGLLVLVKQTKGTNVDRPYVLPNSAGVVLGRLFASGYEAGSLNPHISFDEPIATKLLASRGSDLARSYWGRYVALIRDERSSTTWVLRDPSGGVPCFRSRTDEVDVYFSRLEDFLLLKPRSLTINDRYILGRAAYDATCRRETGLNEVATVLAGERIEHTSFACSSSFFWNPLSFATDSIDDFQTAVRLTRSTVQNCVHAWASCFQSVIHTISGGLDSSIVLACLASVPSRPAIICITEYSAGSDTDERRYARLVTSHLGFEVVERERHFDVNMELLPLLARSPIPVPFTGDLKGVRHQVGLARTHGVGGLFSGYAGDEAFFTGGPFPTAVDFAFEKGLCAKLASVALDDACLSDTSFRQVAQDAIRYGWCRRQWSISNLFRKPLRQLITHAAIETLETDSGLIHPLFRGFLETPPNKTYQAYSQCSHAIRAVNPCLPEDYPASVTPLSSQPFAELSMRIPVWLCAKGGRDRAVAREAFRPLLPQAIVSRRSKGGLDDHIKPILYERVRQCRELLLDGYLCRNGILDRAALEIFLSGAPAIKVAPVAELLTYVDIEGWVSQWERYENRIAA